jgi:hypothetical protein
MSRDSTIEDYARHGVKFFTEHKQGIWTPADNAPSHVQTFALRQVPRINSGILYSAYKYLAQNEALPEYGTSKYHKWLGEDKYATQHINALLQQKVVPKTYDDLLQKAYFYEFQRVVNLLRKHYSDLITTK